MSPEIKEYRSYKDVVATPEAHVAFLRVIAEHINGNDDETQLYRRMSASVRVAGKPFSQSNHMVALEDESGGWDIDEIDDDLKLEMIQLSEKIHAADPGYDVSHFTTGMEYMKRELRERGVDLDRTREAASDCEPV